MTLVRSTSTGKRRAIYLACALVTVGLGLGSRRFGDWLPTFLATYAGDTLWVLAVLLALSAIAPLARLRVRATIALLLAYAVECSQLYHAPWIDAIRGTTVGALLLGSGFLWSDLVCYTVGVSLGALVEGLVHLVPSGCRKSESA